MNPTLRLSRFVLIPALALAAMTLASLPAVAQWGMSALPLAILLGMLFGQVKSKAVSEHSIRFTRFCQQRLLRVGIVLLGFSLSFAEIVAVGWHALLLDALVVCVVFGLGAWVGMRFFHLHRDLAILTAAGSAICGAAAVLATESVLKPRQQDVTVAVATVVLFGTLAMFSYPLIYAWSEMPERAFGIYIGSTVHEVAQAVAAGGSIGGEVLHNAVVVKLMRVMMLAPFILLLSNWLQRAGQGAQTQGHLSIPIPWFVFGFVAAAAVNSLWTLPEPLLALLRSGSQFCLALAMVALGLQTRWQVMHQAGLKPLLLAALLFLLLLGGGFVLNGWLIPW